MYKVKIGLAGLSITMKIKKTIHIRTCMTGNGNFINPGVALEAMDVAIAAATAASADAENGGTTQTAILQVRIKELDLVVRRQAAYVQSESGGDKEKILSSGFDVQKERSASTVPDQPQQLVASTSPYQGQILLKWKRILGITSYSIERSADGNTGWIHCGTSTKSKKSIGDLTAMTYVWFRVIATNAAGDSPASAAVKGLVA